MLFFSAKGKYVESPRGKTGFMQAYGRAHMVETGFS